MLRSVLSIDGGGTKTAGLVADRNGRLSRLKPAQGCNIQDGAGWQAALGALFDQAHDIDFAVIGMPGFGEVPDHDMQVADFVTARIGAAHLIINDVELAFRGAFPDRDGVLVLAGTGSMAIGRSQGIQRRSGGWGHWLGDEGSAFWIGKQALVLATAELDGRAPMTGFAAMLTQALDAPKHPYGLLDWVMQGDTQRARIASVARILDRLALAGNLVARSILDEAAAHLAALMRSASPVGTPWAHAGSVFQSSRILDALIHENGAPTPPVASALTGGLLHAAALAKWNVTPEWTAKVLSQDNPQ
ncbi:N-acetylglucosamine kinase [Octadecabacter sp. R77987]|uniref:N-acetylglucosamine kinase n=1 Tax=Octadecabacter sp. R77987 TaxID=3093874 RepID=UPI0036707056